MFSLARVGEGGGDAHVHGGLVASAVHYGVAGVHPLADGEQHEAGTSRFAVAKPKSRPSPRPGRTMPESS